MASSKKFGKKAGTKAGKEKWDDMKTSKLNSLKTELASRLRWEEDGGKFSEKNTSIPGRHFVQPLQIHAGTHHPSFQWDKKFVIEPFQADAGIGLTEKAGKTQ